MDEREPYQRRQQRTVVYINGVQVDATAGSDVSDLVEGLVGRFVDGTVVTEQANEQATAPVAQPPRYQMIIWPDAPARVQQTLRSMGPWFDARSGVPARSWLRENPVVASVISVATILTVGPAIAGIIVAIVAAGTGASLNPVVSLLAMGLVVGLLVGVPLGWYAVRRWRRRRLAGRWWHYVIPPARLEAAARVPGVGERLTNLAYQIDRLRGHPAVRGGWVPGVDADTLGRFHFTLASELLGTLDLRNAVAEAATHPNLAAQASARQADLAAADQAFDAQLGYLYSIRRTADTINGRLEELALAERLDAGGPTMAQLRAQLSAPAGTDLAGLAGAATEAARLVTEALDPRRLYRPGT